MNQQPFNYLPIIRSLLAFSPRQGRSEQQTAYFLRKWLDRRSISYVRQKFTATIPKTVSAQLVADGVSLPCEGTSFRSGKIHGKQALISSLTSSQNFLYQENINFNPECESVSLSNFYFAPSVAINKKDLPQVSAAKEVSGQVTVRRQTYSTENILVGNITNPKNILIAHYDCIKLGATDNASGVVVLLGLLHDNPEIVRDNLLIFSGNEELSYDEPRYWGHGFRVFEAEYGKVLFSAEAVFVVDCVGNAAPQIFQDDKIALLAFPIQKVTELLPRLFMVGGNIKRLMQVYHSDEDGIEELREEFLKETKEAVLARIR